MVLVPKGWSALLVLVLSRRVAVITLPERVVLTFCVTAASAFKRLVVTKLPRGSVKMRSDALMVPVRIMRVALAFLQDLARWGVSVMTAPV